jgi:plastocyanin
MKHRPFSRGILFAVTAASALAIAFAGLTGINAGAQGRYSADVGTDVGAAATRTVTIQDNSYSSSSLKLHKNDTIVFKWGKPKHRHNVTSASGPATFHSRTTSSHSYSYAHKFTRTGTYSLFCTQHPTQMKLTVKVK